jgi:hypothetical protein
MADPCAGVDGDEVAHLEPQPPVAADDVAAPQTGPTIS